MSEPTSTSGFTVCASCGGAWTALHICPASSAAPMGPQPTRTTTPPGDGVSLPTLEQIAVGELTTLCSTLPHAQSILDKSCTVLAREILALRQTSEDHGHQIADLMEDLSDRLESASARPTEKTWYCDACSGPELPDGSCACTITHYRHQRDDLAAQLARCEGERDASRRDIQYRIDEVMLVTAERNSLQQQLRLMQGANDNNLAAANALQQQLEAARGALARLAAMIEMGERVFRSDNRFERAIPSLTNLAWTHGTWIPRDPTDFREFLSEPTTPTGGQS